jgi:uncharacterized RDD family membrane protein YckC
VDWFYAQNNRQMGPVALDALSALLQRREIQPQDLVWREGMTDWKPAGEIPELSAAIPTGANPVSYYNPQAGFSQPILYAGFWLRLAAHLIDYVILAVLGGIVSQLLAFQTPMFHQHHGSPLFTLLFFGWQASTLTLALHWLYYTLMESSRFQATPGKLALGLAVTDTSGNPVSFGRACGRFFAKALSYATLYFGFAMAGWTDRRQALHDLISDCLVIRKPRSF